MPPAALDLALRLHQDRVYAFALHLVGDADEAADLAQETFIRLWQRGASVADGAQRAWLLRTVRNAALDRLRRRRFAGAAPHDGFDALEGDACAPDDALEHADLTRHAFAALATLADPFRSLVLLCDVQGLPYAEAAEVLDLPLTSVRVYLHRARARLRSAYFLRTRERA